MTIDGPDGKQQVVVPVMAVATALRDMPTGTGWGLAAMGLLLVVMLVTIIGASNADGVVAPGQAATRHTRRRRLVGMGIGLVVVTLILTGWRSWWNSTAEEYRNVQLYRPAPISTSVKIVRWSAATHHPVRYNGYRRKRAVAPDCTVTFLPDHGKLMHAFLVVCRG